MQTPATPSRARRVHWLVVAIFVATVVQLTVGTFARDLPQFAGKGFGARLFTYPLLMLVVPATWLLYSRRSGEIKPVPVAAFAFVMAPFLVDVTGNTADLYDRVTWWDDANHFVNWFLLSMGLGLLLRRSATGWLLALVVTGVGAVLAIGWEIGEWYTFIRMGTELDTAYEDTLGDQVLGTLGAALAGVLLASRRRSHQERVAAQ